AMNTQVCTATKRTPYELVYGQEPHSGFALMKELYDQGIWDEEDIPDNVTVQNYESDDNGESSAHVPESESAPMSSDVMSTNHEAFWKAAAEN
ncbi:7642_t:CDS:2, partial [Paraglomus occultum]